MRGIKRGPARDSQGCTCFAKNLYFPATQYELVINYHTLLFSGARTCTPVRRERIFQASQVLLNTKPQRSQFWFTADTNLFLTKITKGRDTKLHKSCLKQPTNADLTLKYWYRKIFQQNLQIFVGNNYGICRFSEMRNFENHEWVKFRVHVKGKLQSPTGTSKLYTTPTGFAVVVQ